LISFYQFDTKEVVSSVTLPARFATRHTVGQGEGLRGSGGAGALFIRFARGTVFGVFQDIAVKAAGPEEKYMQNWEWAFRERESVAKSTAKSTSTI